MLLKASFLNLEIHGNTKVAFVIHQQDSIFCIYVALDLIQKRSYDVRVYHFPETSSMIQGWCIYSDLITFAYTKHYLCQILILFSNIYLNKFLKDRSLDTLSVFLQIHRQCKEGIIYFNNTIPSQNTNDYLIFCNCSYFFPKYWF